MKIGENDIFLKLLGLIYNGLLVALNTSFVAGRLSRAGAKQTRTRQLVFKRGGARSHESPIPALDLLNPV